ncbi:MAG: leucine-rich repeat domain-containing protein, partial [Anaerolineaceae bacterium]
MENDQNNLIKKYTYREKYYGDQVSVLIDKAKKSKAGKLNLSHLTHSEIPKSLGELTNLYSLDLSGNHIDELPEFLGNLVELRILRLNNNKLTQIPDFFKNFKQLKVLDLFRNQLTTLPDSMGCLSNLQEIILSENKFLAFPEVLCNLSKLEILYITNNMIGELPESIGKLKNLQQLVLGGYECTPGLFTPNSRQEFNKIKNLPVGLLELEKLTKFRLERSYLNQELFTAIENGLPALKAYLRAKAKSGEVVLNEAKLILIGEGEVGKTCLMDALLDNKWQEHDTTHGIQINTVKLKVPNSNLEILLNGWDFGGQRIYRPT